MKPEPFAPWQCPLCGEPLTGDTALKCGRNHSFDRAKEGYWHLLPVQSMRTKAPGDSKEMVAARRAFLNAGYYGIFGRALGELCLAYGAAAGADAPLHLLDAGCGEGWYDRCIAQQFAKAGRPLQMAGFDIAKPAVRLAAKALPAARYAVAQQTSRQHTGVVEDQAVAGAQIRRQVEEMPVLRGTGVLIQHQQPGGVTPLDGRLGDKRWRQVKIKIVGLHTCITRFL